MDLKKLKSLKFNKAIVESMHLTEVVKLTGEETLDDLSERLIHCKKALGIANKIPKTDPNYKKYKSWAMSNLNVIRNALNKIITKLEVELKEE